LSNLFIGLMSGTSLDGVDAALVDFSDGPAKLIAAHWQPYPADLKADLLALNQPGQDEIDRAWQLGNRLARIYADCIHPLLDKAPVSTREIAAIGCHGQTIRHHPERGYTVQIGNAALLAELTGIPVVHDFRSRDIAAGGQGAPLVPAFHAGVFAHPDIHRVIVNIGGISNLTDLPPNGPVRGWDCGPGNLLMDAWCSRHLGCDYDTDGQIAAQHHSHSGLLAQLIAHPFFDNPPPKSTGREDFDLCLAEAALVTDRKDSPKAGSVGGVMPPPGRPKVAFAPPQGEATVGSVGVVLSTLLDLTLHGIVQDIRHHCPGCAEVWVCGGGAHHRELLRRLALALPECRVGVTDTLGIPADWVEACAFAWLARQTLSGFAGNLPAVTGARGPRVLGSVAPA
jgi:anhydro-N-acetylmuramic acid kinase